VVHEQSKGNITGSESLWCITNLDPTVAGCCIFSAAWNMRNIANVPVSSLWNSSSSACCGLDVWWNTILHIAYCTSPTKTMMPRFVAWFYTPLNMLFKKSVDTENYCNTSTWFWKGGFVVSRMILKWWWHFWWHTLLLMWPLIWYLFIYLYRKLFWSTKDVVIIRW